ncbi:MAG: hypothetical protein IKA62_04835 [Clostridia bacterium]|nr:hypothetical protein [Clostridia bacterium]
MKKTRVFAIAIALCMMIATLAALSLTASALNATEYQTGSWNESTKTVTMTTASVTATSVTSDDTTWGVDGQTTYYVVDSDISMETQVDIYGEVHLILKRSYTNTKNLIINENASLHIHKATDATYAVMNVYQIKCKGTAIVIHGGEVETTYAYYHGIQISNGDAIIYAGEVTATIGRDSAGPDGGGGSIKIYGGEIDARTTDDIVTIGASEYASKFSSIEIYNAKIYAKNDFESSLGDDCVIGGNVDRIIIENSNVISMSNGHTKSAGAGIGGEVSEIYIANSTVNAWGGLTTSASGIKADNVYLKNSTVTVRAGDYGTPQGYGIYCKNLTIEGGYVMTDTGSESDEWKGIGYYVSETMTVLSGTVNASEGISLPSSKGAKLVITGGSVIASRIYEKTLDISSLSYVYTDVVPVDASGNVLYGRTIALDGVSDKTSVTAITGAPSGYDLNGIKTIENKICIWGGENMLPTEVTVNGNQYTGAIASGALNTSGTFYKVHTCTDSDSNDACDICGEIMPISVQDGVYLIYDLSDYNYFKGLVEGTLKNGEFDPKAKVKLMADLDIGKVTVGTEDFPFRGEFDGNYHSLTVNLTNVPTGITLAPFNYADGAAFKRLTVKGSIVSDLEKIGSNQSCINIGGFVGITKGEAVSFDECINLAGVKIRNFGGAPTGNLGGFVGMNYTNITFTNCASLGRIDVGVADGGSGVVGNSQSGCKVYLDSCYIYLEFGVAKAKAYRSGSLDNSYVCRNADDTHITNSYYNVTRIDTPGSGDKAGVIGVKNTSDGFKIVNAENIANGNLVNLLNKDDNTTGVWKQTLTGDSVDAYPNFTGKRVVWNVDGQKYDNHEHTEVYALATVNAENDTVNISCPVCSISGQNVTISIPTENTYDVNIMPTATVTGGEAITVVYMSGSTVLSEAPKEVGNYTASFTLGGKTATVVYNIVPKSIESVDVENDVTVSGNGVIFNGNEQTLNVTEIKFDGVTLVEGTDFTVTGNKQTNAGEHTVTVIGKGNYKGSVTLVYIINQAPLTVTANDHTITYGELPTNNGVTYTGFVGSDTESVIIGAPTYTYSYEQYGNVGEYTITPAGVTADNYKMTFVPGKLTVEKKVVGVTAEAKTKTYGDADPEFTYITSGLVNGDILEGALARAEGENVGEYLIGVGTLNNDNYTITYTGAKLTVEQKHITVTADDQSVAQYLPFPEYTYKVEGLVGEDTLLVEPTFSVSITDTKTVGEYEITVDGADAGDNYSITHVNALLTVTDHVECFGGRRTCTAGPICEGCGKIYDEPLAHMWDEGVITTEATCTGEGVITYNCLLNRDHFKTEAIEIDETAHTDVDENGICDDCKTDLTSEDETTEAPEDVTTEIPEDETTEAPEDVTTEAPEDETTEASEDETTEAPEDETTEAPEDVTTEAPEDETTEAPEDVTTEIPEDETTEAPEDETTEAPTDQPAQPTTPGNKPSNPSTGNPKPETPASSGGCRGCKGTVGGASIGLIALIGVGVFLAFKKKKEQ